jgi:orotate phosphoribosyltransferase
MMAFENDRDELKRLLLEKSVRRGEFKLASGLTSNVYIDAKPVTCSARGTLLIGRVFLEIIRKRGWQPAAIGGIVLGAAPIVLAIARESAEHGPPIDGFLVRKEPKKHGTERYIEALERTEGLPVVVIDDVCTTGGSTVDAIERSRAAGMTVLGAVCLVDREMGARERIANELRCPFEGIFRLRELVH